ncbi:MAG: NAD(P)H-dependent oxidoreductase [Ilumatobacteraceae bacterium]
MTDTSLPTNSAPTRTILGVIGSLRRDSFNRRLLEHAAATAPARLRIDIAADLIRLPLFNEDLEVDGGFPPEVAEMHARIRAADGLLLATPEYNFGVPGTVKNFLDWASRPPGRGPLTGKPVALIGASTGRVGGTVQAQGQLRISLAVMGAHVLPSPPVLIAEAPTRFGDQGISDELTAKILGFALDRFADFIDSLAPRPT